MLGRYVSEIKMLFQYTGTVESFEHNALKFYRKFEYLMIFTKILPLNFNYGATYIEVIPYIIAVYVCSNYICTYKIMCSDLTSNSKFNYTILHMVINKFNTLAMQ